MTSLTDVIAEALNSAYPESNDDGDLRKWNRHDGHKYYAACYVCRGDVPELARRVRDALLANHWMRMVLIAKLEEIAGYYPADIFTPEGNTPDGIAGTAIRMRMLAEIRRLKEAS